MPLELQIELRANRGGTVLPDTHGQVWTELCAWAEQDGNGVMFGGARRDVEEQLSRALKFNTREQFPVRRLAILWKNDRWRTFVTRLCGRRAGKDLFNISTFQKMSSCRIDDYLFERIESIMRPLDSIYEEFGIELELERDYARLAGLHRRWKPYELFYPKEHNEFDINEDSPRHPQFLSTVDKSKYHALYRYLLGNGRDISLPNAHELLRRLNSHGKTMQAIMTHIVMWLNNDLANVHDREGNKPSLAEELLPVVSSMPEMEENPHFAAKTKTLELQRTVLTYVEKHAAAFTTVDLALLPEANVEPKIYQDRFRLEVWREVLVRVREAIGPRFRNPCVRDFHAATVAQPLRQPKLGLVDALQDVAIGHAEVAGNAMLKRSEAIEALRFIMEGALTRWRREYGQSGTGRQQQVVEARAAAVFPERVLSGEDSASSPPAVDERSDLDRETVPTRESPDTNIRVATRKRTSLFVESDESEGQLESPKAPEARMDPSVRGVGRDNSTVSSKRTQASTAICSFSENDDQDEREASPFWNSSLSRTAAARKVHRVQRKEATIGSDNTSTLRKAGTPRSLHTTSLPTKSHVRLQAGPVRANGSARPQQTQGWRTRPFAGA